jgi:hypothetical protein
MYELDAIETINIDQLVTATDRLLLRCKRTVQRPGRRSTIDFTHEAQLALAASNARQTEATAQVRTPRGKQLISAVAVIAGAWLGVAVACLLT